jgi:hypothetical protein
MNMKKIIALLIGVLMIAMAAGQKYSDSAAVDMSFISQVPDPVQPGGYADVRFKVSNLGTQPVKDIQVEFLPSYPFTLDPGEKSLYEILSLDALQKDDAGVVLKYKVRVDSKAVEGNNPIKLRYRLGTGGWSTLEYNVNIQTLDANVAITDVQTTPEVISPGDPFTIRLTVKNLADSAVRDLSLNLNLVLAASATVTASSAADSLDTLPFAPINSVTEKRIQTLGAGEETVFSYTMIAYPDARSKVYKVPLQLSFTDALSVRRNRTDVIGILVDAEPDVRTVLEDSTITGRGQTGDITVKFINKGLTDIKFLDVKLVENDLILPISADEVYIGNVDSDDYQTAEFKVFVRNGGTEDVAIPLHYEFMDAANHQHAYDTKLSLKLDVKKESQQYTKSSGPGAWVYVIGAVALVIVGLIVFRMRRRKK